MRVLHVISDHNIGGAGVLLLNLLEHFDPSRIESRVALPRGSALIPRLEALGIACIPLAHNCDRFTPSSVRELLRLIHAESIDLVSANAALSARIAGRLGGVRVVHTRHCCFPPEGVWRFLPMCALGGLFNRLLSDRVIATAEAAANDLCRLGVPREKVTVIVNGAAPVREVGERELDAARCAWEIPRDAFCIGICARLVPCKGHETFLHAAKLLCDASPDRDFRFLLAGEGELREVLEGLARDLGIGDRVKFLGFLEDTAPFYRIIRINVNCSIGTETSCLAISEGMSAGVPTVASDYGGNPAMLGEGHAGRLFPKGDPHALAERLCEIAKNPALEQEMKTAARLTYEHRFTPRRMADEVVSLYESLFSSN